MEHTRKLIGDIARTRNHCAFGQGIKVEDLVGRDAQLCARDGGDGRPCANRDQDGARRDLLAARQPHRVGANDGRALMEVLHLVAVERVGVEPFQPGDIVVDEIAQARPVKLCALNVPAEAGGPRANLQRSARRKRASSWARSPG
jgi:hypothetical protein